MIRIAATPIVVLCVAAVLRSATAQEHSASPRDVFRTAAQAVLVYASVVGASGQPIVGLGREDFEMESDGVAQPILHFAPHDGRLTFALLFDMSASVRLSIPYLDAAIEELAKTLRPDDRVRVGVFGRRFYLTATFSRDAAEARKLARQALRQLEVEDTLGPSPIWDATWKAATALLEAPGPHAVLVATDGRATGNHLGLADLAEGAAAAGVAIHPIVQRTREAIRQSATTSVIIQPDAPMARLADYTGGAVADAFPREPKRMLSAALASARPAYVLGFAGAADGRRHKLTVRVKRPDAVVRARMTYLARKGVATDDK